MRRSFASDNNSGLDPMVLEALQAANQDHEIGYGEDPYTRAAEAAFQKELGDVAVFPVLTGTAANVLCISALLQPFEAVICSKMAHLWVDECGAPERFCGNKLIPLDTADGKLMPAQISTVLCGRGDEHRVQPRMISITQPTEVGTLYSREEITNLAEFAHQQGLFLHVDGARIANAAAALNCSFKDLLRDTGVDIVSFGGTKNGLLNAEAVVFMNPAQAKNMPYLRKQAMQLNSKMRFLSVQWEKALQSDHWLKNAKKANQMAALLAQAVFEIPEIEPAWPVQSNAVFAKVPKALIQPLQAEYYFYVWDESASIVRWMCSFDTQEIDIINFVNTIQDILNKGVQT
ncbi:threonine aldolase [bacterium (Candidatus Blackallbacteria) CG17_big_fil_post_rev_8_21_14_2_50_48_46]|uniref:Threonine aldolase n=1 Tax=bacterium (Candidatus Blackallbacteria) CG17_big_fil_post_rev_8_21_14_2_50_48_46 TaxID=2014261 RepID=A0A2M7G2M7_9BACT|nr:MAG: threonine aldolase [bacterium (Candidatus Blackallbacteria) CG18_big_fil_WC_8_21_14_2_50_49_26]PIW16043.1 MAG: threonine aldolase [bacterium (Candidatus Blackallbacteria) CG17_big_fil_post_rev_8_21_14_2_50_48_46]PIW50455.1 MAG: threonine aldolase [bacterium (Candidatus Blackallbacteria) CG13_big_fil_rev_8_21_14_2_50_49_14]